MQIDIGFTVVSCNATEISIISVLLLGRCYVILPNYALVEQKIINLSPILTLTYLQHAIMDYISII